MDFLFMITGGVCLLEAILLFVGKDMMIFNNTTCKKEDYDLKPLCRVEGILFLIDGVGCLLLAMWDMSMEMEFVFMGLIFVTLFIHYRVFRGDKYKIKKKK